MWVVDDAIHHHDEHCAKQTLAIMMRKEDAEENMKNVPAFWKKAVLDDSISKLAELSNKNPNGILGVSVYKNPEDSQLHDLIRWG